MTVRLHDNTEALIPTRHGNRVAIFRPDPASIQIEDIAAALARKFRWSGQCDVTVAQHSVHVSHRLAGYEAKWGLMHDAAEAYLPDMARPLKDKCLIGVPQGPLALTYEQYVAVENRLLRVIGAAFGLGWPVPAAVWTADDREMCREARDLFGDASAAEFAYPEPLTITPAPLAGSLFLRRFVELFREPN